MDNNKQQCTHKVLMIRPVDFHQNLETLEDNPFQDTNLSNQLIHQQALAEFDQLVAKLSRAGIKICVVEDSKQPSTPDSIFPNNRISFHPNGLAVQYALKNPNRRLESQLDVLTPLAENAMFNLDKTLDYSIYEKQNMFLEGTGSMVLDRVNRIAFAAISSRTSASLVTKWCLELGYRPIMFDAEYQNQPIYHTNVMMSLGDKIAIFATQAIPNKTERKQVLTAIEQTGRQVIEISPKQMQHFCANILQLRTTDGKSIFALSQSAYDNFSHQQIHILKSQGQLIYSDLSWIEKASGGSVRCLLAEVF